MKSNAFVFFFICLFLFCLAGVALAEPVGECPCEQSIQALVKTYNTDPDFHKLVDSAFKNIKQLPPEYPDGNPWLGKSFDDLVAFFREWCTFLPVAKGSHDNGLKYIEHFVWFYYQNPDGVKVVQTSPGREIFQDFVKQRGAFMDSPASAKEIPVWLKDERIEKEDYNLPDPDAPDGGFKSFNEFFARKFKDQASCRPQTMPDRDYVISAPTDCIMNSIPQKIVDEDTPVPTKLRQNLTITQMLDDSTYAKKFVGGTALSCVLMPNTYHRFHAPVSGKMVEAKVVKDAYFGYDDFPKWAPQSGNVGYYGSDFSQFENFQRGYYIIDTGKYGYVAMVAVGLNTISSIVINDAFKDLSSPVPVKRGDELGNFFYGGSLFIMIFEPGKYKSDAIQVRLGNQIGTFDTE